MVEDDGGENMIGDRNTKKVRFKGLDFDSENDMVVDSILMPEISWRDKVLGQGPPNSGRDEDFELLDGDVVRTMVNEFNPLQAFPRNTMVWVKLLGLLGFLYKRQILEKIERLIGLAIQKKCAWVWGLQRMLLWVKVKRWKTYWSSKAQQGLETKLTVNNSSNLPGMKIAEIGAMEAIFLGIRHSAITFEENVKLNNVNPIEVDILVGKGKGIPVSKGRGSGIKGVFSEVVVLLVR
ncbi:hypothetical protein GOBAR_DD07648 [Gossypium barbadense]|nr:hypothetical protein GOBAR_DD07648 [Gossypium barbadense]